jgi:hypothetical protein
MQPERKQNGNRGMGETHQTICQSLDTDPQAEHVQIELIRRLSVAQRISLVRSLSRTTMFLSRRAIQRANPSMSEREVDLAFVELHYGKELAGRLRSYIENKRR